MTGRFAALLAAGALALTSGALAPGAAEARQGIKWWMGSPGAYAYIAPPGGWNDLRWSYLGPRHYPPYAPNSPAYSLSGTPDLSVPIPRKRSFRR